MKMNSGMIRSHRYSEPHSWVNCRISPAGSCQVSCTPHAIGPISVSSTISAPRSQSNEINRFDIIYFSPAAERTYSSPADGDILSYRRKNKQEDRILKEGKGKREQGTGNSPHCLAENESNSCQDQLQKTITRISGGPHRIATLCKSKP